jgi:hypothetical protein
MQLTKNPGYGCLVNRFVGCWLISKLISHWQLTCCQKRLGCKSCQSTIFLLSDSKLEELENDQGIWLDALNIETPPAEVKIGLEHVPSLSHVAVIAFACSKTPSGGKKGV